VTPAFGRPRRHFRLTGSTNDEARALAEAGAPSGAVVTADEQDAGRGRHGRRWSAPAGSALLCSAVLHPLGAGHSLLPLAVPLAVCGAIEALAPVRCAVKWPNDVWIDERKVAGVLIEARPPEWAVIGVGVNLSVGDDEFPRALRWPATSVGHGAEPEDALDALTDALSRWADADADAIVAAFTERDALRGREVSWEGAGDHGAGTGVAAGIDARGDLLVQRSDGEPVALGSGEVSLALAR
jgi:BirA family transcriptional regulator, biotin operon repressor / biotin---[acetyl-CoA-carboxylase] ligase